jgi:hypothetical protein
VNTFEVAVLRVLVKRQQPLTLSALVNGFPDDSEDNVLSAISSLKLQGYLVLEDYQPNGYVSINKARRKEILQIVDSDIHSHKLEASHTKESYYSSIPSKEKKSFGQIITGYSISQAIKAIAISSLLIFGVAIAVGSSMPTTSPDTESIAYHQYMPYKKWSGSAYGASDYDGVKNLNSSYTPASESFVGLKDCNQKPSQQQT